MNAAKAIERALVATIREHATLGEGVVIRTWQSLREDGETSFARAFPCVDVRCAPPMVDDNGRTLSCVASILCASKVDDDQDHAIVSGAYEAVQEVCDSLYGQSLGTAGAETATFMASIAESDSSMAVGGISFEQGLAPYDEEGVSFIGVNLRIHYSRGDF
jgi:hypothetical protein